MQTPSFEEIVSRITRKDTRYGREAFFFVRDALNHTQAAIAKETKGTRSAPRHVSGQELLEGIRHYALNTYGPMTLMLLTDWRIRRCEDFGEIVFLLVDNGALSKTENDQPTDFQQGYDFDSAFRKPFLPERVKARPLPEPSQA